MLFESSLSIWRYKSTSLASLPPLTDNYASLNEIAYYVKKSKKGSFKHPGMHDRKYCQPK